MDYIRSSDSAFVVDEDQPYAELWYALFPYEPYFVMFHVEMVLFHIRMGTHPSGPSKTQDGSLLLEYLSDKPSQVGAVPEGYPSADLPFLFKVLSIKTALSIQVACLRLPV